MKTENPYPLYRRNAAGNSFYRITGSDEFYELRISRSFYSVYYIKVKIHPERMLINDLIDLSENMYAESTDEEFINELLRCSLHLKKV